MPRGVEQINHNEKEKVLINQTLHPRFLFTTTISTFSVFLNSTVETTTATYMFFLCTPDALPAAHACSPNVVTEITLAG